MSENTRIITMNQTTALHVFFFLFLKCMDVQSEVTRRELLNNLTLSMTYDQGYSALYDTNIPTDVIVQLEISDVTSISEQQMEYSTMMFVRMQWEDHRLAFYDLANFTRIELSGDMVELIWTPDVFISNEKKVDPHSFVKHEKLAYIGPNGTVTFSMRVSMTANCQMDLHQYPFDKQTCIVRLQSYAFTSDKLLLQWSGDSLLLSDIKLTNYDVEKDQCLAGLEKGDSRSLAGGSFSYLQTGLKITRKSSAYGSMYFGPFPVFFIIAMTSFGFREQISSRITLCTTGISATLLQWIAIYSRLPPVWYFTYLDGWILFHICIIGAILVYQAFWYVCVFQKELKEKKEKEQKEKEKQAPENQQQADEPTPENQHQADKPQAPENQQQADQPRAQGNQQQAKEPRVPSVVRIILKRNKMEAVWFSAFLILYGVISVFLLISWSKACELYYFFLSLAVASPLVLFLMVWFVYAIVKRICCCCCDNS